MRNKTKIYLYNTLSRKKELFKPINAKLVSLYTCGPTVYNYAHLGNMRAYVASDILRRVLEIDGYKVKQVINITDVGHLTSDQDTGEDKIELGSRREGKTAWKIAEFYTDAFQGQVKKLNIQEPSIWTKATEHIRDMVELIKRLEHEGYTYITGDGVYFDTSKVKNYGHLARLDIAGLKPGARIKMVPGKKNPTDFALWKFSPKGIKRQMEWESPLAPSGSLGKVKGFPGWHIECSAMSMKYLGETIDLHTGGVDHIGVHHTNEIAQSEAATGKKFVNYWLHNEHLILDAGKMSKSVGDFITLDTLINEGYEPLAFRYLCLMSHYRSKIKFSWETLKAAENTLENIRALASRDQQQYNKADEDAVLEALNNDLDTPHALAILHQKNSYLLWQKFEPVLALGLDKPRTKEVPADIKALVGKRDQARVDKNFKEADRIRKELAKGGFKIEDTPNGTKILLE